MVVETAHLAAVLFRTGALEAAGQLGAVAAVQADVELTLGDVRVTPVSRPACGQSRYGQMAQRPEQGTTAPWHTAGQDNTTTSPRSPLSGCLYRDVIWGTESLYPIQIQCNIAEIYEGLAP